MTGSFGEPISRMLFSTPTITHGARWGGAQGGGAQGGGFEYQHHYLVSGRQQLTQIAEASHKATDLPQRDPVGHLQALNGTADMAHQTW